MAIVGFAVPQPTSSILSGIDVPGVKEPIGNLHITVLMLEDDSDIGDIADAMEAAYSVAGKIRPFTARVSRITSFPGNKNGVPIICPVEAPELQVVWQSMKDAFDKKRVDYSKKFPEFKPHVTLSYSDKPFEDREIMPIEWGAHELIVWGGNRGDRMVEIHLPLTLADRVAHRYRVAMQERRGGERRVGIGVSVGGQGISSRRLVERFKARD